MDYLFYYLKKNMTWQNFIYILIWFDLISLIYKKRLCRYSTSVLFIQCICTVHFTVHLQWKFGEEFCLPFFFFFFSNSSYSPSGTIATVVTIFFFFGLSFVLFFLLYILFYWHNKFYNIFTIIKVSISYKSK